MEGGEMRITEKRRRRSERKKANTVCRWMCVVVSLHMSKGISFDNAAGNGICHEEVEEVDAVESECKV